MQRISLLILACLLPLHGIASPSDAMNKPASPAKSAKVDPAKGGVIAQGVCLACHASDGNSPTASYPKLAGQHPEYLAKQLHDFKQNTTRKNPVMLGFASTLSDEDIRNVAAYYSQQKVKLGYAKDPAMVKLGEKIYRGGIADKKVPACASCHGPVGHGIPSQYPALNAQWADYTKAQLIAFRNGERQNDHNEMMRAISLRLTDKEIGAVAEYIAGLQTAKDSRIQTSSR